MPLLNTGRYQCLHDMIVGKGYYLLFFFTTNNCYSQSTYLWPDLQSFLVLVAK